MEKAVKRMSRHESELVKVAREAKQAGMTYGKYVGLMWQQEQKKERVRDGFHAKTDCQRSRAITWHVYTMKR